MLCLNPRFDGAFLIRDDVAAIDCFGVVLIPDLMGLF